MAEKNGHRSRPVDDSRRGAIIRLLETMNDGLPEPRGQWSSFGAVPGEKATEKVTCRSCGGDGQINTRKGLEPCQRCSGNGFILVDSYTREPEKQPAPPAPKVRLGAMTGPERTDWRQRVDAALVRVREQLAVGVAGPQTVEDEIAEANRSGGYEWERTRRRLHKNFDHSILQRWLDAMRHSGHTEIARAAAAVQTVYTYGFSEPSTTLEADTEFGLALLDKLMPDPIRAPGVGRAEHPARARIRRRAA